MRRIAVLLLVLTAACSGGGGKLAAAPSTTAVPVDVPALLLEHVCGGRPAFCTIDDSDPDVVVFQMQVPKQEGLSAAGKATGLWSAADAVRMVTTSRADGPQTSTSGAVSWTFEPVSGLTLIIDVTQS